MNTQDAPAAAQKIDLVKATLAAPALAVTGKRSIAVKDGTLIAGIGFAVETSVAFPGAGLEPGEDYLVLASGGSPIAVKNVGVALPSDCIGGFHFAAGGNAPPSGAMPDTRPRSGGGTEPAINPNSVWDLLFRPGCDPRGMAVVDGPRGLYWCDIYLLAADHLACTSRFGVTIADGNDPPRRVDSSGDYGKLDYATAKEVLAHHGKGLLSFEEFAAAAYGVTERTAAGKDPKVTGLDAARTSCSGIMQATGNLWVWGHDGDPDAPRASVLGGSWLSDVSAGSRCAFLDNWPGSSYDDIGARGRCDHLQPA